MVWNRYSNAQVDKIDCNMQSKNKCMKLLLKLEWMYKHRDLTFYLIYSVSGYFLKNFAFVIKNIKSDKSLGKTCIIHE